MKVTTSNVERKDVDPGSKAQQGTGSTGSGMVISAALTAATPVVGGAIISYT